MNNTNPSSSQSPADFQGGDGAAHVLKAIMPLHGDRENNDSDSFNVAQYGAECIFCEMTGNDVRNSYFGPGAGVLRIHDGRVVDIRLIKRDAIEYAVPANDCLSIVDLYVFIVDNCPQYSVHGLIEAATLVKHPQIGEDGRVEKFVVNRHDLKPIDRSMVSRYRS